jgi:hypothetical protein
MSRPAPSTPCPQKTGPTAVKMFHKTTIDKQPLILNTYTSIVNMKIADFILYRKPEKTVPFRAVPAHSGKTASHSF